MDAPVILGAAMVATALPVAWWAVAGERATSRAVAANLRRGLGGADLRAVTLARPGSERAVRPIAARVRALTPVTILDRLERKIVAAGVQATWPLDRVLTVKLLAGGFGAIVGLLGLLGNPSPMTFLLFLVFTAAGFYGPDVVLGRRAAERATAVRRELPDVVDQLMLSIEAGLGLDQAMARVVRRADTILTTELARTVQDVQLGSTRGRALEALTDRLDVPELRRVVAAIRHADRYGVSVANVLRVQAQDLRERQRQLAEEHAKKIPVKILVPLVFCILPALFVAILGPAIIEFVGG